MGYQERATILALADTLAEVLSDKRALLVASSDLSHYCSAEQAAVLDERVVDYVNRFDLEGPLGEFERYPQQDRGGATLRAAAVLRAARVLGATEATVLKRADSGDVSGDKTQVVGYLAAIMTT